MSALLQKAPALPAVLILLVPRCQQPALTRTSDRTGFRNGPNAPTAARLAAALSFCHSAWEFLCTTAIHQPREACARSLICRYKGKMEDVAELPPVPTATISMLGEVNCIDLLLLIPVHSFVF